MPIVLDGSLGVTTPMYNGTITANAVTPSVNMKNRIINGAMVIDQRNAGASVTTNGYTLDRWASFTSGTGVFSVQQSSTAPTGFNNSCLLTVTTADASVTGGDYYLLTQYIEGYNFADLNFGTANAKTVTISFWVRASITGTYGGCLRNGAGDYCYPFQYVISSANTWEQKSVTIAGATSGTWLTTNGLGAALWFSIGAGSDYTDAVNVWTTKAGTISANSSTNLISTNGATFYVTGVQLEVGSTATSFDYRPYGTELALCQRYFQKHTGELYSSYGATINYLWWLYKVTMRATPTVTGSTGTSLIITVDAATNYSTGAAYAYFTNPTASAEL